MSVQLYTRLIGFGLMMAIAMLLASCTRAYSGQSRVVVAEVGEERIFAEEFRTAYVDYLFKTGLEDEPASRTRVLNSIIDTYLLAADARKTGIEETEAFQAAHARHQTKFLIEAFVQQVLYDTLQVAESELEEMFVRANTVLTARHLYARTKDEAEQLYEQLQQGATFDALAPTVFADTALANNGGFIGEFTLDDMDLPFEEAAFALDIGEISPPVKTTTGYSIIKLEDRFVKPLITAYEFAERRGRMMHFVSYRKKIAARKTYAQDVAASLAPVYDMTVVNQLLGQITGAGPVLQGETSDAWQSQTLLTYTKQGRQTSLDVATFRAMAAATSDAQRATVNDLASFQQFTAGLLVREAMLESARALNLEDLPVYKTALAQADRAWVRDYEASRMLADASVSEAEIQDYYKENREALVHQPATRVWEILVEHKTTADSLLRMSGTTAFTQLARDHSLRPGAGAAGGDLGYLTEQQMGEMRAAIQGAETGEILGPLEIRGYYVLLKIGDRLPARPMTLEEAVPSIKAALGREDGKSRLQEHLKVLRAQQTIVIDEPLLAALSLKKEK